MCGPLYWMAALRKIWGSVPAGPTTREVSSQVSNAPSSLVLNEQSRSGGGSSLSDARLYSDGRPRPPPPDDPGISAAELDRRLDMLALEFG